MHLITCIHLFFVILDLYMFVVVCECMGMSVYVCVREVVVVGDDKEKEREGLKKRGGG